MRTFLRRVWVVTTLGLLSCAEQPRLDDTSMQSVSALDAAATDAIAKKWVKLGGDAGLGAATSALTAGPNATRYQRFANGALVYSDAWGAVLVSEQVLDAWLALAGRTSTRGGELLAYVGVPSVDIETAGPVARARLERGMIVAQPGSARTIEGPIYLHYSELDGSPGLPLAEEELVSGGWRQQFENGDVYYAAGGKAAAISGSIRDRWLALGGVDGALGFPLTDVGAVPGGGQQTVTSLFEGGAIYSSAATGAWELTGPIYDAYLRQYGGPSGWLGLPTSGQRDTPTSGGVFNDFEHGVIVHHDSGPNAGTYAVKNVGITFTRIQGDGGDCWCPPIGPCICGGVDVYLEVRVDTPAGRVVDVRLPDRGDYGDDKSFTASYAVADRAYGDLAVHVEVEGWDADDTSGDDYMGTVDADFSADNLWGNFEATEHGASNDGLSFSVWFKPDLDYPWVLTDFPSQAYWSFQNFGTPSLTYDQFAATFADVSHDESRIFNPFDALFYEWVYEGLASGGNCFGMSLESVYAQKGRSLYDEPIFQYFPATQGGCEPDPDEPAQQSAIDAINVKHGYQLGASEIVWFLGLFTSGETHDPVGVYEASKAAAEAGDSPTLSITSGYFGGGAHSVRPYRWESDGTTRRIYIADPNNPAGGPDYQESVIEITDHHYEYPGWDYSGGAWTGGRMFYYPFHVMSEQPLTPFYVPFELVEDVFMVFVGATGQTTQVSDNAGRTFYEPDLPGAPTRWDQIRADDQSRVPDLARVALANSQSTGVPLEVYAGKASGGTYRYDVGLRDGSPAGTPYQHLFNSAAFSSYLSVPGTPGVPDRIGLEGVGTADPSVSVTIPAGGEAKEVAWKVAGHHKRRWAELTHLQLVPSQAVRVRLANAGSQLVFENDGPDTTAELRVESDSGAGPVDVGVIPIPGGTATFSFDAPKTTPTYAGGQPGRGGWLVTPVTVTLQAQDFSGSGIAYIEYGVDAGDWITYAGPFPYPQEGDTELHYRAMDNVGDLEAARTQRFMIDTRAPEVTVSVDEAQVARVDAFVVHYTATDPTPGSGLDSVDASLDDLPVVDGQSVDLLWMALGTHTVTATATDVAGWETTASATFTVTADLASLRATIIELRQRNEIRSDGLETSLLAMEASAERAVAAGCHDRAVKKLDVLEHHVLVESKSPWFWAKSLSAGAADLLVGDIEFVSAHLPEASPSCTPEASPSCTPEVEQELDRIDAGAP